MIPFVMLFTFILFICSLIGRIGLFYFAPDPEKKDKVEVIKALAFTLDMVLTTTAIHLASLGAFLSVCRRWEKFADLVTIAAMIAPTLLQCIIQSLNID